MADIDVTIGLDYQRFKSGLAEVERSSARAAQGIERAMRFAILSRGVTSAFNLAGAAVREYARDNEDAQRVMREWSEITGKIQRDIGRDLVDSMRESKDFLDGFLDSFRDARREFVGYLVDPFRRNAFGGAAGETAADAYAAADAEDASVKAAAKARHIMDLERDYRREMQGDHWAQMRMSGDRLGADIEEIDERGARRAERINRDKELDEARKRRLIDESQTISLSLMRSTMEEAIKDAKDEVGNARRSLSTRDPGLGIGGDRFARNGLLNQRFAVEDPVAKAQNKLQKIQEESKAILQNIERNTGKPQPALAG